MHIGKSVKIGSKFFFKISKNRNVARGQSVTDQKVVGVPLQVVGVPLQLVGVPLQLQKVVGVPLQPLGVPG